MKAFFAFALIPLSFGLYLYLETKTEFSQRVPWLHYGLSLVGLILLALLIKEKASWFRVSLTVVGVILVGGFAWWTLSYSTYKDDPGEMTGKSVAEFFLANRQGTLVNLGQLMGNFDRTLAVFYRGYW